jgi:RHS repeat-associated protein
MRYLYGPAVDQILGRTSSSGSIAWYLTNQVGSVVQIRNSSGTDIDDIVYDPFGNITTQTNASNGDRFMFAGMQYDSTTGLYYDHARYYDASIGRFVSQDPKGFSAGDTNLYRYVSNEPTDQVDLTGMQQGFGGGFGLTFTPRAKKGSRISVSGTGYGSWNGGGAWGPGGSAGPVVTYTPGSGWSRTIVLQPASPDPIPQLPFEEPILIGPDPYNGSWSHVDLQPVPTSAPTRIPIWRRIFRGRPSRQ